jgi:hypothetical protein
MRRHRLKLSHGIFWALLAVLLPRCPPVWAIYVLDDVPVATYNNLAAQSQYSPAVYLADNTVAGGGLAAQSCSGVLVSPTTILTAAHCASGWTASGVSFGFNANLPSSFATNQIAGIVINPAWASPTDFRHDEALLKLTTPVTSVAPATLFTGNITGMIGTLLGYGRQDTGNLQYELCPTPGNPGGICPAKGLLPNANNRLAAQNVIDTFDATDGLWEADFDAPGNVTTAPFTTIGRTTPDSLNILGSAIPLADEGMLCSGDSGGPLFVNVGGQTVLAGTNESIDSPFFSTPNCGYGNTGFWTTFDDPRNIAFLESTDPAIQFAPEPMSGVLLATGLLGMAAARRRQAAHRAASRAGIGRNFAAVAASSSNIRCSPLSSMARTLNGNGKPTSSTDSTPRVPAGAGAVSRT